MARMRKRKSDSALPGRTSKRKTSRSSTEPSEASWGDMEPSNDLFVEEPPVNINPLKKSNLKPRRSEPICTKKVDEYVEDQGRSESQHFLALVEFDNQKKRMAAKAASEFMENFKKGIKTDGERLKERLRVLNTASREEDEEFLSVFKDAYGLSRPTCPPKQGLEDEEGTNASTCFSLLYEHSQRLVTNALKVVEVFESANDKTLQVEKSNFTDNSWDRDEAETAKLLAFGRTVGLKKYRALLAASDPPAIEEDKSGFLDALYPWEESNAVSWDEIAKKQEKAVRKLAKTFLPLDVSS